MASEKKEEIIEKHLTEKDQWLIIRISILNAILHLHLKHNVKSHKEQKKYGGFKTWQNTKKNKSSRQEADKFLIHFFFKAFSHGRWNVMEDNVRHFKISSYEM